MTQRLLQVVSLSLLCSSVTPADPCNPRKIPEQIRSALATEYAGWRIVTPAVLEASDQKEWVDNYSNECPGMISGRFSGNVDGYVFNLIRKRAGKTLQQVVYYPTSDEKVVPMVIWPRAEAQVPIVISKFPPGRYTSFYDRNSISIKTDTIGISKLGAWTLVYYWHGTRFRTILTSD
jgi:hypothetical protein